MNTNDPSAEKPADRSALVQRAKEHCHDATYLGTDATGAVHCWSIYHQTGIVFEDYADLEPQLVAIPTYERTTATAIEDLGAWCAYITDTRGEWDELLVSESLVAQAAAVIEA